MEGETGHGTGKMSEKQLIITFGGSCACGRITYSSTDMPKSSCCCNCISCRKLSGGPYQAYPGVDADKITFFDNKEALRYDGLPIDNMGGITYLRLSKAGERAYCISCYTPLAMRYRHDPKSIAITLGTVDEETISDPQVKEGLTPVSHIFTSQRTWWQPEKSGLPCYERFSGTFESEIEQAGTSISSQTPAA